MECDIGGPLNEQEKKEKMAKNGSEIRLNHALEELRKHAGGEEYPILEEFIRLINFDEEYKALLEANMERIRILKPLLKEFKTNEEFKLDDDIMETAKVYQKLKRYYQNAVDQYFRWSKENFKEIQLFQLQEQTLTNFIEIGLDKLHSGIVFPDDVKKVILQELKKTQISTAIELYNEFGLSDEEVLNKLDERD